MLTLHKLDCEQTRQMYSWIEAAFPEDERRPLFMMLQLMERGLYEVLAFCEEDVPVGYALTMLPRNSRAVLLDYLVVDKNLRSKGYGSVILAMLRTHYADRADAVIIESEYPAGAPEPAVASRRMGFYARAGAETLSFRVLLWGVDYSLLALPTASSLPPADWQAVILDIYRQTLPPVFFAAHVRLITE